MDVDLLRPGTVPISPDTILWFEFLLDPNLLGNHLKKKFADPSPTDLIVKFLSIFPDQKEEIKIVDGESDSNEEISIYKKNRKSLALKILSLKVAAFLKFDLSILESKLPLPIQVTLFQDMLFCAREKDASIESHLELDLAAVPKHILFAISLYHRWVLRAIIFNKTIMKQQRPSYVPVPGLQDPTFVPPSVSEDILRNLEAQSSISITILDRILVESSAPKIPLMQTFVMLTEDSTDVSQNWNTGQEIILQDFQCQLHYDLGKFHLFREEYSLAREHFHQTGELFQILEQQKHDDIHYTTVSREELLGCCQACGLMSFSDSVLLQMHDAINSQYMGIIQVLQQDNIVKEIPQVHRDILELDIQGAVSSGKFTVAKDLLLQVQTLNVVCKVATGTPRYADYVSRLRQCGSKGLDMLIGALCPVFFQAHAVYKTRLKTFLMDLIECEEIEDLAERVMTCQPLISLFTVQEISGIMRKIESQKKSPDLSPLLRLSAWDVHDTTHYRNPRFDIGSLEQQLIITYNAEEIQSLLAKLAQVMNPMKPQWTINNKWELPIPLQSVVTNLPRGFLQDYTYILLAKSRELTRIHNFHAALDLLKKVESELTCSSGGVNSSILYKLGRLLSWEALLIHILQFLLEWPSNQIDNQRLMSDCKMCLSTLQSKDAVIPRLEILEYCVICLLNLGEWEYLTTLDKHWASFELSSAIAAACADIAKHKGNKKVPKEAWELILPVFSSSSQTKRSSSGATSVIHRESPTNVSTLAAYTSLMQFIFDLRDVTPLAVMISLLARLHNVLRDEPSLELCVDYSGLWPAVISNTKSYNLKTVSETLIQLISHGLKYHPNNVSWLKVMADINFVLGHHSTAMKYYLEAGIVVTDYFTQPLPRAIMDDQVFRRMIKCCSHLQCYTQVAVLCQFLEEVDYTTAFKSLGDVKNGLCNDAMDSYYNCIWDTTILEYLIHLHTKRGELHRRQQTVKVIGLLELNSNNNEEIQREAANIRKARFLRALSRQYIT